MIIFLDTQGALVGTSSSEPIGRNSNDVGMIYVVAPFSAATTIYFTFTLPNGDTLFGNLAEPAEGEVDTRQAATHLFGVSDTDLNVWRYKLKASVTRYAGTVHYTVVTKTESITATAYGTFTVSRGNKITLPGNPPEDAWTTICTALSTQGTDIETLIERLCGDLKSETPAEGTIAARVAKNESDIEANRVTLYGTDGNAEEPADGLVQRMTAAEGAISTVKDDISAAESALDNLKASVEDEENGLAAKMKKPALGKVPRVPALFADGNERYFELTNYNSPGALVPVTSNSEYGKTDKGGYVSTTLPKHAYHAANKMYVDGICFSAGYESKSGTLVLTLYNVEDGTFLGSAEVSLPLEQFVQSGKMNEDGTKIILTLNTGGEVEIGVSEIVGGLVSTESLNKLLEKKLGTDAIVQETGDSTEAVMSQKAVTEELAKKVTADYANDGFPRVYGKASNGAPKNYTIITSCYEESLPLRAKKSATSGMNDYGGCLTTSMPTQPYHCAPKKYVDEKIASLDVGVTNALGERVETVTEIIEYWPAGPYTLPENTLRFVRIENAVFDYYYGIYTNEEMTEMETGGVTETVTEVYNGEEWVMIPEDGYVQLAEGATTFELHIPDYNNMGPEGSFMMGCYHNFTLTYQVKVGA